MHFFLSLLFLFGSLLVQVPDVDLGKNHEITHDLCFQNPISVFRKDVRHRAQKPHQQNGTIDVDQIQQILIRHNHLCLTFEPLLVSFHFLDLVGSQTLPIPPPFLS